MGPKHPQPIPSFLSAPHAINRKDTCCMREPSEPPTLAWLSEVASAVVSPWCHSAPSERIFCSM